MANQDTDDRIKGLTDKVCELTKTNSSLKSRLEGVESSFRRYQIAAVVNMTLAVVAIMGATLMWTSPPRVVPLNDRTGRLERDVARLTTDVDRLRKEVRNLGVKTERLERLERPTGNQESGPRQ